MNEYQKLNKIKIKKDNVPIGNNYIWLASAGGVRGNEITKTLNYHSDICFLTEDQTLNSFYLLLKSIPFYMHLEESEIEIYICGGYEEARKKKGKLKERDIVLASNLRKYWDLYASTNKNNKRIFGVKYPLALYNYKAIESITPDAKFCYSEDSVLISMSKWFDAIPNTQEGFSERMIYLAKLIISHNTLCKNKGWKNLKTDKIKDKETFFLVFKDIFDWLEIKNNEIEILWEKTFDIWTIQYKINKNILEILPEIKEKDNELYNILISDVRYYDEYDYWDYVL
jgi:hypothetical protein